MKDNGGPAFPVGRFLSKGRRPQAAGGGGEMTLLPVFAVAGMLEAAKLQLLGVVSENDEKDEK